MERCKVKTTNAGEPSYKSLRELDYRNKRQTTIVHIHGQYYNMKMKLRKLKELANAYLFKVSKRRKRSPDTYIFNIPPIPLLINMILGNLVFSYTYI